MVEVVQAVVETTGVDSKIEIVEPTCDALLHTVCGLKDAQLKSNTITYAFQVRTGSWRCQRNQNYLFC